MTASWEYLNEMTADVNDLPVHPKDFNVFSGYYAAYLTALSHWMMLVDALNERYKDDADSRKRPYGAGDLLFTIKGMYKDFEEMAAAFRAKKHALVNEFRKGLSIEWHFQGYMRATDRW